MKDQLVFDTTSVDTIADSDKVGAFVTSSDGSLIDHQNVNSENWLNVAALLYDDAGSPITDANPLAVSVKDGVNVEVDLDHADDSVAIGDGTNLVTVTQNGADYGLDVNLINSSIAVTATDLDIRDLAFATDSVDVSGSSVSISGDVNVTQGTSPWVVSATDLDIRDLSAAQDSIASHLFDGSGTALTSSLVGADQALDVNVVQNVPAVANTSIVSAAETLDVANTAQDVVASPLSDRKTIWIYNFQNKKMFIGGSGVTESSGFPVSPGSYLEIAAGPAVDIEFVSSTLGHEIRTLELS